MDTASNPKLAQQPATGMPSHNALKRIVILIAVAVICGAFAIGYFLFTAPREHPVSLPVSGRIEGYETNIGPKIGGRVDVINYREGESVKRGALIVQISDDDVQAQLRGTEARIKKAKEQVEEAKYKIQFVQTQIDSAELKLDQSQEESNGRIRQWQSMVSSDQAKVGDAEAQLAQAKADFQLASIRKDRYAFLVSKLAVTKDEYDQAVTTYETAKAVVNSRYASLEAQRRVLRADMGQLKQAQASRMNPPMNRQELLGYRKQLLQADHELKSAQHDVANAIADRDQIQANIAYLKILSPIDGVVTARAVEPGAVVVPGQTLLSIIDLNSVYLRAYVPEGHIDKVRIGQKAKIILDGSPDRPLDGEVIQIDPQGSFTPENIYFKDDRVRQVFGIKIAVHQPRWFAKPGMPADAEISLN